MAWTIRIDSVTNVDGVCEVALTIREDGALRDRRVYGYANVEAMTVGYIQADIKRSLENLAQAEAAINKLKAAAEGKEFPIVGL